MTPLPLTELNKLIEGATDGPWEYWPDYYAIKTDRSPVNDAVTIAKTSCGNGAEHSNGTFITVARDALPNALRVIAECKRVLEEAKHALEMSPIYARKEGVWINARVKGSAMFHLKHEDERFTESFQLAGDLNNAAKVSADKALALCDQFESNVLQQEKM